MKNKEKEKIEYIPEEEDGVRKIKKLLKKIKELKKEKQEYLAGWQRVQADFINYKKRVEEEKQNSKKYANQDLILEILPVLDQLELALKNTLPRLKNSNWIKGIEQIKNGFAAILKSRGIEAIPALKKSFNPEFHEAVATKKGLKIKNIIQEEVQKGYTLNGKVIRPSKVVIK